MFLDVQQPTVSYRVVYSLDVEEKRSKTMRKPSIIALTAIILTMAVGAQNPLPAAAWGYMIPTVTPAGPEATNACGPATVQMALSGYPSTTPVNCPTTFSVPATQFEISAAIAGHQVEALWDADPVGIEKTLESCGGSWVVKAMATREEVMHWVARWLGKYKFAVPVVLNTATTGSGSHAHGENWALIFGIHTDVDPTVNPAPTTINVTGVWFLDPGATVSLTPAVGFSNAATWATQFQPVTKTGSAYNGKFVAVIEPPEVSGRAIFPGKLPLLGPVLPAEQVLVAARRAIERHDLTQQPAFEALVGGKPLPPVLVNRQQGGYYLVPFSEDGETAGIALLVNAYDGSLIEARTFEPTSFLGAEEARALALRHLGTQPPGEIAVEAVFLNEAGAAGRYRPTWKVRAGGEVLGVTQDGTVIPRITDELHALTVGSRRLAGIAGNDERLWVTDRSSGEVLEILPASGAVLRRLALDLGQPKGLAFDGSQLWVADEKTMRIQAFDPEAGGRTRSIPLEVPKEKGFGSLEAVAWDGKYLWTAISAGFSSSLNQVDPRDGRIVRSLFADCDPRGLASDGERLWTLCYNGKNRPPTIDERLLLATDKDVLRSRRFFKKAEGQSPSGLAYDGDFLWYTDAERNRAVRFTAPRSGDEQGSSEQ